MAGAKTIQLGNGDKITLEPDQMLCDGAKDCNKVLVEQSGEGYSIDEEGDVICDDCKEKGYGTF